MKRQLLTETVLGIVTIALAFSGCKPTSQNTPAVTSTPSPAPTVTPTPIVKIRELPITLPVLDALFFVDRTFVDRLKVDLQLSDEQIGQLRQTVRAETSSLRERESAGEVGRTSAAGERATERISAIVGAEKAERLAQLALQLWQAAIEGSIEDATLIPLATPLLAATLDPRGLSSPSPSPSSTLSSSPSPAPTRDATSTLPVASAPYNAPADTRIIVNAPAYRMDVFSGGQLIKTYKIAIGYPEFPLPTGMRKATYIIFNPTWIPPDEPWVEASSQIKVGQKVAAGDKLNPLGPIKIPIGLPSLIHGGKSPAKIGSFASHGCVGLTNKQVQSFSKVLARLSGLELSDEDIVKYEKAPTETKALKLNSVVPVELRYETIAVEDGKLHIYRDIYDRDTNVVENLEAVLAAYDVTLGDLNEEERTQVLAALEVMASRPAVKPGSEPLTAAQTAAERHKKIARGQLTRQMKGKKEIAIAIGALVGKGYPVPVDLDTGTLAKPTRTKR